MTGETQTQMAADERQFDQEFADELEQLSYYSHGDHVEVKIVGVGRTADLTATVTFAPPVGDTFDIEMAVPVDPSTDAEFTDLLSLAGQNFDTAQDCIGERIPAQYTDEGWVIQYPEPEYSYRERAWGGVAKLKDAKYRAAFTITGTIGALLLWPIAALFGFGFAVSTEQDEDLADFDIVDAALLYPVTSGIWFLLFTMVREVINLQLVIA